MKRIGVLVTLITVNLAIEQLEKNKCVFKKNNFFTADDMGYWLGKDVKECIQEKYCKLKGNGCSKEYKCIKFVPFSDKFEGLDFKNTYVITCIKDENVLKFASTYGYDFIEMERSEYENDGSKDSRHLVSKRKQLFTSYDIVEDCITGNDNNKAGKLFYDTCYQVCTQDADCEDYEKDKTQPSLRKCFTLKPRAKDEGYLFDPDIKPVSLKICRKEKYLFQFINNSELFESYGYKAFPNDIEIRDDEDWKFLKSVKLKVQIKGFPDNYEEKEFDVNCFKMRRNDYLDYYQLSEPISEKGPDGLYDTNGVCNSFNGKIIYEHKEFNHSDSLFKTDIRKKIAYDFQGRKNIKGYTIINLILLFLYDILKH
jgi:hypothetical protein